MPAPRLASLTPPGPRAAAASSFPCSCPADDGGRWAAEYDANGHYLLGPRLRAPSLVRMIADAQAAESPNEARRAATAAIAAERRAYRQSLLPGTTSACRPATRRGGGLRALAAAIRGTPWR